ncbi:MAG: hypothetical protein AB1847_19965 [bacterium]
MTIPYDTSSQQLLPAASSLNSIFTTRHRFLSSPPSPVFQLTAEAASISCLVYRCEERVNIRLDGPSSTIFPACMTAIQSLVFLAGVMCQDSACADKCKGFSLKEREAD